MAYCHMFQSQNDIMSPRLEKLSMKNKREIPRQKYYHLHSTVKREGFAHLYFSSETVSQTTVSTGPMTFINFGA